MFAAFARRSADAADSRYHTGERLLNCYAEPLEGQGPVEVRSVSGLKRFGALDAGGEVSALAEMAGALYAVGGGALWRIDSSGAAANVGPIAEGRARIAVSGTEVAVVAGGIYHVYDGGTVTTPETGDITLARDVAFLDGYFIVIGETVGRRDAYINSGVDDGKTFLGDDLAFARAKPDALVGIIADHGEVMLMGETSAQLAYNAGSDTVPIRPNPGAVIEEGCADGRTLAAADNGVFWVGPGGIVRRSDGASPRVVSTRQVEQALQAAPLAGAVVLKDKGHLIYAVMREGLSTWCYDLSTGEWFERATGVSGGEWMGRSAAYAWGAQYVGGRDGRLYVLDRDTFTDGGDVLLREAVSLPVTQGGRPYTVPRLTLALKTGHSDLGRPAQVMFSTSNDGRRWSRERTLSLGTIGEYEKSVPVHGLGAFTSGRFRLRMTDPADLAVSGVNIG